MSVVRLAMFYIDAIIDALSYPSGSKANRKFNTLQNYMQNYMQNYICKIVSKIICKLVCKLTTFHVFSLQRFWRSRIRKPASNHRWNFEHLRKWKFEPIFCKMSFFWILNLFCIKLQVKLSTSKIVKVWTNILQIVFFNLQSILHQITGLSLNI